MVANRVRMQVLSCLQHPQAIIGTTWQRFPAGATPHYEEWANSLTCERLWLEQFREVTVQMPTWMMTRAIYDRYSK